MTRERQQVPVDELTREELLALVRDLARKMEGDIYLDQESAKARPAERMSATRVGQLGANYYRLSLSLDGHLACEEAADMLDAIDEGEDPIVEADDWGHCGNITYRTAAGHTVVVFNDCGDWDYVDSITAADGRRWEYEDGTGRTPSSRASNWSPGNPSVWGIPLKNQQSAAGLIASALDILKGK